MTKVITIFLLYIYVFYTRRSTYLYQYFTFSEYKITIVYAFLHVQESNVLEVPA